MLIIKSNISTLVLVTTLSNAVLEMREAPLEIQSLHPDANHILT